jgi:hypothetical protein
LTCLPVKKAGIAIINPMEELAARRQLYGIPGSLWASNLSSTGKRRILIGDTPINHGRGEGSYMQIEFRNCYRQA